MTSLFPLSEHVDAVGVEWQAGTPDDVNDLLDKNHYLGPIKSGGYNLITMGVKDGEVVAAQVWRRPTARRLPNDGSWLELSRWCLTPGAGENAGSRQHKHAVRLIKDQRPNCTTLVSYSDPGHGHTGALYRACNWLWRPTWLRLRPPPGGHGAWTKGKPQSVKDRWVFPVRPDKTRESVTYIDDPGAIRYWAKNGTPEQKRWARTHPQLKEYSE